MLISHPGRAVVVSADLCCWLKPCVFLWPCACLLAFLCAGIALPLCSYTDAAVCSLLVLSLPLLLPDRWDSFSLVCCCSCVQVCVCVLLRNITDRGINEQMCVLYNRSRSTGTYIMHANACRGEERRNPEPAGSCLADQVSVSGSPSL